MQAGQGHREPGGSPRGQGRAARTGDLQPRHHDPVPAAAVGAVQQVHLTRLLEAPQVVADRLADGSVHDDPARLEHHAPRAQRLDDRHVVAHEQYRAPLLGHGFHPAEALPLERGVAHGEHLVDDQDLGPRWAATENASRTYIPLE